ncbi:MAG: PKD domain-containing protein, partial [Rhodothermia bacterium]
MQSKKPLGLGIATTALLAVSMLTLGLNTVTAQVLQQSVKPLKIRAIIGKDTVRVGDVESYRVIVNEPRDVEYRWSTGDRSAFGNPVVHRFKRPGTHKVIVTARNVVSTARDSLTITVLGPEPPYVARATTREERDMPAESAPPVANNPPAVPVRTTRDRSAPPDARVVTTARPSETPGNLQAGFKGK